MNVGRTLLAAAIVAATVAGGATAAAPKHWYWTENLAEKSALAKVRIPCLRVRAARDCNPASAAAERQSFVDNTETCAALPDLSSQANCLSFQLTARDPDWNLQAVKRGFELQSAECVGGGKADASGYRFRQFRCVVTVRDFETAKDYRTVRGRIVMYATGMRSFRWSVIAP